MTTSAPIRVSDVLRRPRTGPAVWKGVRPARSGAWVLRLSSAQVDEIDAALRAVRERGLPLLKVTAADFPLPTLTGQLRCMADELENGRGFVLVKRVPVERYSPAAASALFWGLGRHLGVPVSQNARGHMLGHSRDTGRTLADPSTRAYETRGRLPFHTDGSDALALLCLRSARTGGRVAVASSGAVYNALLERRPDLVDRLYRTHFLDRREGQVPAELPYLAVPLAAWHAGRLSMRYHRSSLESAQRFPGVPPLEPADIELFDLIDELAQSPELRLDLDFEPGDLLLLGNHTVLHSRTAYEDHPDPEPKRHVLRLSLALREGRELPDGYWGDTRATDTDSGTGTDTDSDTAAGPGRGGVTPRDEIAKRR
ncbi:TauD/TfdA family dioxygenase [Streptomyces boluensis]|uniref:TauD/TfdA family dioxygenase n=1 Tax=Streptomyces boluensis TaxID=1775135 RepID=A0A964XMA1_9ACTN|nr:TauD/TfdA family dioxygenase [Streptomyces boluensis]NBE52956.1 TauD/TfdA family dioxygenase [Streptomyces boluensis]